MPAPRIPRKGTEICHHLRPDGVEVEVADEFQEVGFLLHHDGFVPVLEEMTRPVVAAVEGPRVPREETAHAPGEGAMPRPEQEVRVVREQGPGVDGERPTLRQRRDARDECQRSPVESHLGSPKLSHLQLLSKVVRSGHCTVDDHTDQVPVAEEDSAYSHQDFSVIGWDQRGGSVWATPTGSAG